jgi:glycosyltransferase involved in cell wall biosynthesis
MKISIVTVCFNSEKTLERTLKSIIAQNYQNKEIVIIDGGSKDSTLEILEKYREHIGVLVSEKDNGIYDGMNKGWQKASGDFVHFLNSDDWYVDSKVLSKVAAQIKDQNTIYHGKVIYKHNSGHETVMGRPATYADQKYELRGIHQPASFFPRALFKTLGGFDLNYRISSDYDLIRRFLKSVPAQFLDIDVTYMSDAGASAKNINLGLEENFKIAVKDGGSPLALRSHNAWVGFWLKIRYQHPHFFQFLKKTKDALLK